MEDRLTPKSSCVPVIQRRSDEGKNDCFKVLLRKDKLDVSLPPETKEAGVNHGSGFIWSE